jgi:hypothetical protein
MLIRHITIEIIICLERFMFSFFKTSLFRKIMSENLDQNMSLMYP